MFFGPCGFSEEILLHLFAPVQIKVEFSMKFTSRDLSLKRTPSKKQSGVFGVKINVVTKCVHSLCHHHPLTMSHTRVVGKLMLLLVIFAGASAPRCLTLSASALRKWRRGGSMKWESTGSQGWPLTFRTSNQYLTQVRIHEFPPNRKHLTCTKSHGMIMETM